MSVLLFDTYIQFALAESDRLFSSDLVERLNNYANRPWKDLHRGKPIDERWLARQLGPYGVRTRNIRVNGVQAKGYCRDDLIEPVRRYVPKAEARALLDEFKPVPESVPEASPSPGSEQST